MNYAKIKKMDNIFFCKTPPDHYFKPRFIPDGMEEIEIITAGFGEFLYEDEWIDVGPGGCLWFYSGEAIIAKSHKKEPYETYVFRFEFESHADEKRIFHSSWRDFEQCVSFCAYVMDIYKSGDYKEPSFSECVYSRLFWEAEACERSFRKSEIPPALKNALDFIKSHYTEQISVDDVARFSMVSSSHLHLLFRTHLGVSPMQMAIRLRMQKARAELLSSDKSIKEISAVAGFSDINNFCHYFKKENKGLSPSSFRRKHFHF
jgi:AraC-like DNA-binding protein